MEAIIIVLSIMVLIISFSHLSLIVQFENLRERVKQLEKEEEIN